MPAVPSSKKYCSLTVNYILITANKMQYKQLSPIHTVFNQIIKFS